MTRRFVVVAALGWLLIAVGVAGVLGAGSAVPPLSFARWVLGLALLHDLVFAPLVLLTSRAVPARWRALALRVAISTGCLVALAWPQLRGWGRAPANPSIQPRDYTQGLLLAVAAVLGVVAAVSAARRACRARRAASPARSR